jgi:hypothetical protein
MKGGRRLQPRENIPGGSIRIVSQRIFRRLAQSVAKRDIVDDVVSLAVSKQCRARAERRQICRQQYAGLKLLQNKSITFWVAGHESVG